MKNEQYRFQVNLKGMIDVLSNHLYSSPKVYIRELLQNATDAITARYDIDQNTSGSISIEMNQSEDAPSSIMFVDNGIGLTEEQLHEFLAVIGQSSKMIDPENETGFIGRFGIGLLSCFMVSDEIVMITKSVHSETGFEWRGLPDGTYEVKELSSDLSPGTRVFLRAKTGFEEFFQVEEVEKLIKHYGCLLPYPIVLTFQGEERIINADRPDWIFDAKTIVCDEEALRFGKEMLGEEFIDYIPLRTSAGTTGGIAYVLPHAVNLNAKKMHKVFLKKMLVSENIDNIMPDWAFFVKCVIWTDDLRPTASRESFYENENLEITREEMGMAIRQALVTMSVTNPLRLKRIIAVHDLAMKALAVDDDEFYRIIIKWLPFETTYGYQKIDEIVDEAHVLNYTNTVDEYRQIVKIANSHSICVVNGGYVYDNTLLERLSLVDEKILLNKISAEDIMHTFEDVTLDERNHVYDFLRLADLVLQSYQCNADMKKFEPKEMAALYIPSPEVKTMRDLQQVQEQSNDLFSSVLSGFIQEIRPISYANLCLNYKNELVQQIIHVDDPEVQKHLVKLLYIHSLLLGHHALKKEELSLLNTGLHHLLEWGLRKK